ncbi:hypothetical protein PRZ48_008898 [Zasmidium cellare]|uniref:Zn(2)-C6 fungal-type domain-containing protein n=1 Tax=Zasmidium cellare TaxID=395010 RepID=A0ABR0EGT5_ZASCE|nr:hypothetical protein PRZ48_008898 [Zasmidium cellare]
MSSNTLTRACTWCKHDKKGCDLQRPCERCANRGRTADECIESAIPPPPTRAKPTTKRAAPAAKKSPAKKRAKKETEVEEESALEAEKNGETEGEGEEAGEEDLGAVDDVGDDQPLDELIWREGDPGVAYDTEISVEEDEEGEEASGAEGEVAAQPSNELPYYATPTYSALANRGFRMPVKTRQSVADLPDDDE